MKITFLLALMFCLAILIVTTAPAAAQSFDNIPVESARPTLRGAEAVDNLKRNGQYDGLMRAVRESQSKDAPPDAPPTDLAIGQSAKLLASDVGANDQFGYGIAISGDTAVVSTPLQDTAPNSDNGAAYVYTRTGTVWSQQAKLLASDRATNDQFGWSVAIDGDTIVVGALRQDTAPNTDNGAAYVFTRSGSVWTQQAKLIASDAATGDFFGSSVAIFGDTAVIGAYRQSTAPNSNNGAAYVFARSGAAWSQAAKLLASDTASADYFGWSVAIDGDTIVAGAPLKSTAPNTQNGAAYVFTRTGGVWSQQAKLLASDTASTDFFGQTVAISGDTLVAGAPTQDTAPNTNTGAAYVFARSGAAWSQAAKLLASDAATNDDFGWSVAISGDKIVAGAIGSDIGTSSPLTRGDFIPQASNQGGAYFFVNAPLVPTAANVAVSGRVLTNDGAGLRNAIVYLTKANGETVTARTTTFGYYRFDDIAAGQTVVIGVNSKRYLFMPQVVEISGDLTELNFSAME